MALDLPLAAALLRRMCYDRCTYYADRVLTEDELRDWCDMCPIQTLQEMIKEATP